MKNVVLFGAGASAFAGDIRPYPPATGSKLYAKLRDLYPTAWGRLPGSITEEFRRDFEAGMVSFLNSGHLDLFYTCMRALTHYFSQFKAGPKGNDLYSGFLTALNDVGVIQETLVSTLNYECIFETAAMNLGLKVRHPTGPPQPGEVAVWKLHGACNIFALPSGFSFRDVQVSGMPMNRFLHIDGPLTAIPLDGVPTHLSEFTTEYAAMAMYAPGKEVSFQPELFLNLQREWAEVVGRAHEIAVIGVNYVHDDKHIWDSLTKTKARVHFVGNKRAFEKWMSVEHGGVRTYSCHDFKDAIESIATAFTVR